jgi:hypothetical protein
MSTSHHIAHQLSCAGPQLGLSRLIPVEGRLCNQVDLRHRANNPGLSRSITKNTKIKRSEHVTIKMKTEDGYDLLRGVDIEELINHQIGDFISWISTWVLLPNSVA